MQRGTLTGRATLTGKTALDGRIATLTGILSIIGNCVATLAIGTTLVMAATGNDEATAVGSVGKPMTDATIETTVGTIGSASITEVIAEGTAATAVGSGISLGRMLDTIGNS